MSSNPPPAPIFHRVVNPMPEPGDHWTRVNNGRVDNYYVRRVVVTAGLAYCDRDDGLCPGSRISSMRLGMGGWKFVARNVRTPPERIGFRARVPKERECPRPTVVMPESFAPEELAELRRKLAKGMPHRQIADECGVHLCVVEHFAKGMR